MISKFLPCKGSVTRTREDGGELSDLWFSGRKVEKAKAGDLLMIYYCNEVVWK